jgi:hypothetical protein
VLPGLRRFVPLSLVLAGLALSTGCDPAGASGTGGSGGTGESGGSGGSAGAEGGAAPVCGGIQPSVISSEDFPDDCAGLDSEQALACAEKRFWLVLREDYAGRAPFYDVLTGLIDQLQPEIAPEKAADLWFRKGQLAMILALEHADQAKIFDVEPAFDEALALYPGHPIVPTWRDTMRIAIAVVTKDYVLLQELFDQALANVELCPLGNIPSLTGTTIGAPLSTGIPQKTVELAKSWKCEGVAWCTENTWKGPYVVAGMRYHMGEAFARVGDKQSALEYFQSAAAAPGFDTWPFAAFVQDKIDNIDAFLGEYAALGQDGSAFDLSYANSSFGCRFCHGVNAATP